jgi:hypothetical protein
MEQAFFELNTGKYASAAEELLKSEMGLRVLRRVMNNEPRAWGNPVMGLVAGPEALGSKSR